MLVILSFIAGSVISIQYFKNQMVLRDIAQVKALYAAESGIAKVLASCENQDAIETSLNQSPLNIIFPDSSKTMVEIKPWGVFLLVQSRGKFRKSEVMRSAFVADIPSSVFDNALVFGNRNHQLVFSGTSSVTGDVIVGQSGVTVGNLRNRTSPIKIPVSGKISRELNPDFPIFHSFPFEQQITFYEKLLRHEAQINQHQAMVFVQEAEIRSKTIPDSINYVFVKGDAHLNAKIQRRDIPLYIIVEGNVSLAGITVLEGLITIIAAKRIDVREQTFVQQGILFSKDSITIATSKTVSGQFISPVIHIESDAFLTYPSVVFSTPLSSFPLEKQEIKLKSGSKVEGMIALISRNNIEQPERIIIIEEGATIIGTVFSDNKVTFDGTINGTVVTKDFYFYESPTTYYGWLRGGTIDRTNLPTGYLLPSGFTNQARLSVLEWL
ncbi:MAG: hypothetical protein HY960_13735 [Ignavibacteriae bacterium]|nr:hypothetical protein [Ignavibacteriota bacterium]